MPEMAQIARGQEEKAAQSGSGNVTATGPALNIQAASDNQLIKYPSPLAQPASTLSAPKATTTKATMDLRTFDQDPKVKDQPLETDDEFETVNLDDDEDFDFEKVEMEEAEMADWEEV